jgi:WXG100 family type VII secretion target
MANITVSSQQLRSTSAELRGLNGTLKSNVGSLEATESSLAGMWQGQAKKAFHNAFIRDKTQMDTFYAEIEKYCATLETIAAKYDQAESLNVETATTRTY